VQDSTVLQVYEVGPLTVLGFGGREILDQIDMVAIRNQIVELVKQHAVKTLAFDLLGVKLIPSGMLGLLASLRTLGVEVQLFNPSEDVLEVLEVTKLNQVFKVESLDR
jgi:anti-sigma B factor antagonist